jgi:hypothetical protein
MIIALFWEGWDMKPCTQNCLLVTDNSFNQCSYCCVQTYFTLRCTWFYWMLFLIFFFAYLAKNIHAVTCTHTHIPVKASHSLDSQSLLQCVCVCVCMHVRVRARVGARGGGVWLRMHVGVHTCVCTLCYQLKFVMSQKSPCLLFVPKERQFS